MYILDSSAIAIIIKRFRENCIEILKDNITLDLARYELGNIIWKECILKELVSPIEAIIKAEQMIKILNIMKIESIKTDEDFKEAMELAINLKITFYDASYLQLAKSKRLILVTEDMKFFEKAKQAGIEAVNVSEFQKHFQR